MKIAEAEIIELSIPFQDGSSGVGLMPSQWTHLDIALLKLTTDDGVVGWGDGFAYHCRSATVAALRDMVLPHVIGAEIEGIPRFNRQLQQRLHLHGRYGITIFALSAVDIALWDIKAKMAGKPLSHLFTDKPGEQYDIRDILACIVDSRTAPNAEGHESLEPDLDEYKSDYGKSLCCAYAKIGGHSVGIVANQGSLTERTLPGGKAGPSKSVNMPRVISDDSADKAARFIMDCNQRKIPLVFIHDTTGFMVGRDSEQGGIIRSGAKMVNAMANCIVPKIVVILGGSFGAGNYAMCGRAFDQFVAMAWPGSKCAVMGAGSATGTLAMIEERSRARKGEEVDEATHKAILDAVADSYNEQQDIRHGAARGWVDRIIEPHRTREELIASLDAANQGWDYSRDLKTGVLQV